MSGARRRVLVIEDHRDSADSLVALLRLKGHTAEVSYDGESALQLARRFHPEVVLCDIGLAGTLDGYAVARAMRADADLAAARLVAMSGYGEREDRRRSEEAGFDVHLTKPVDLDVIESIVAASGLAG